MIITSMSPSASLVGAVSTNHSFTRLSFHPHGQGPERVGRRLTAVSDGWRLDGNLKTLGYFAANVCLGADHKTFSLIVDTGSSLAAMPCADCSGCGKHKTGARFDPSRPGATTVDCHHPPTNMRCNGIMHQASLRQPAHSATGQIPAADKRSAHSMIRVGTRASRPA